MMKSDSSSNLQLLTSLQSTPNRFRKANESRPLREAFQLIYMMLHASYPVFLSATYRTAATLLWEHLDGLLVGKARQQRQAEDVIAFPSKDIWTHPVHRRVEN
jgi:hypothetical protein